MNSPTPAYYEAMAAARGVRPTPARSWSILLTSANHGVVGPLGSTFPHAGEKHERVQVVELVGSSTPPAPGTDLGGLVRLNVTELVDSLDEVYSWARELPIPTRGTVSAMQKVRQVKEALAGAPVAAQAGQVAAADLHDAIMRIACDTTKSTFASKDERRAYAEGHRDARHAAAELAAGAAAGQVAVPEGWTVERVGNAIHIKRADGKWCGTMPSIGPAAALTFEFLSAMLAAAPSAPAVAQQAPAATIDTREFRELLAKAMDAAELATRTGDPHRDYKPARDALVAHIDARLGAQASTAGERQEGGAA